LTESEPTNTTAPASDTFAHPPGASPPRPGNRKRPIRRSVKREAGVYLWDEEEVSRKLGFTPHEFDTVFRRLSNGGYISATWKYVTIGSGRGVSGYYDLRCDVVTETGLRRLGELPDPHKQFLMGLEAAIQEIKTDNRLTEAEKKREIDWLEEASSSQDRLRQMRLRPYSVVM
jgi:hypothetical protein